MDMNLTKVSKPTKTSKTSKTQMAPPIQPIKPAITKELLLKTYLETRNTLGENTNAELEVRFGSKNIVKITKNMFDASIKFLLSKNFNFKDNGITYLNISLDEIRIQINNAINIQKFCNSNQLPNDDENGYTYTKKTQAMINDVPAFINFDDFNFRISYSKETNLTAKNELVEKLKETWMTSKKNFRLINRYTLVHPDYPVRIDLSIVRDAYSTTIRDSNIFKSIQKYEIEVEVLNTIETLEELNNVIFKVTKYILCGLQNTNYPVSYNELKEIGKSYLSLISSGSNTSEISPTNFIGPSSVTLQISNITEEKENSNIINIRTNYSVTDKADGERKLLYINNTGKIYLINTQCAIEFTGAVTMVEELFNTLLDGELIKHNKNGTFINLYAAFDIYFSSGIDVRELEFKGKKTKAKDVKYRWTLLESTIKNLNAVRINPSQSSQPSQPSPLRIEAKTFYDITDEMTLFKACDTIQKNIEANNYEYNTDGLIFTPLNYGVGLTKTDTKIKSYKHTWDLSFKWKPAEFNTIDFLVTTKKTSTKTDFIGNKYDAGTDVQKLDQIIQYKTLILRVGYDVKKHGYANPYQYIIDDTIPLLSNTDNNDSFKPVQFIPSNPYDPDAGLTNIELKMDAMNEKQMFTEENEVIEDNTIVECRYDMTRPKGWNWIPLRIRYDKSAEFRAGYKNYGNAYHVAQNNWFSIHNPISIEMITTGNNIQDNSQEDIYYNEEQGENGKQSEKKAKGLRDFHNLVVKNRLITSFSKAGDTLIDYAVGRGGDLPKWNSAKLSFVFGIDYSKDNILNPMSGVCSRYLTYKQRFVGVPNALFAHGNSSKNIKDTSAFITDLDKKVANAIFGIGKSDGLPKGLLKSFGIANEGFNISSIQFAVHYMFENIETLNNFLTNIAECTKLNGYFIGTCFDGKKIFKLLNSLNEKDIYTYFNEEKNYKLLEITKQYSESVFKDDISCLGYAIDIYQSSINKNIREYLVNFDYFTMLLETYGFIPLTTEELKKFNFNKSIDSFEVLYEEMTKTDRYKRGNNFGDADKMVQSEKEISFLNNYFIYKKVRNVEVKDINSAFRNSVQYEKELSQPLEAAQFNDLQANANDLQANANDLQANANDLQANAVEDQSFMLSPQLTRKVAFPSLATAKQSIAPVLESMVMSSAESAAAEQSIAEAKQSMADAKQIIADAKQSIADAKRISDLSSTSSAAIQSSAKSKLIIAEASAKQSIAKAKLSIAKAKQIIEEASAKQSMAEASAKQSMAEASAAKQSMAEASAAKQSMAEASAKQSMAEASAAKQSMDKLSVSSTMKLPESISPAQKSSLTNTKKSLKLTKQTSLQSSE